MAQYPDDVEIFLPAGVVIRGRQAVADAFGDMVKPFNEGGLFGVTAAQVSTFSTEDLNEKRRR
jgi:ketosteroid isomerase-like protein